MGVLKVLNKLIGKKDKNELAVYKKNIFEEIPKEIIELLWFKDGPCKNYNEKSDEESIYIGDIKVTMSYSFNTEPSLISVSDVVKEPKNDEVEAPGYFPSYSGLSPNQRWIYLNWISNIDEDIDISYVFVFYYGLERHLLLGNYTKAWNIVNRLRKHHKSKSFIGYSTDALIASCIVHNRADLFIELLNNTENIDDIAISDLYLLAKHRLCGDITAKEMMKIASSIEFKNNRYIRNDALVFENELINIIRDRFNKDGVELTQFKLEKCPKKISTIIANYSLDESQRQVKIPSLIGHKQFKDLVYELLSQAHEATKLRLKEIRKSGSTVPTVKNDNKKAKKKPDKVFNESILFNQIDINMFDKNIDFYNNYICPYCGEKVSKMPVSKGKCQLCKNDILVKNSVFTGEKIAITLEENKKMIEVRNERTRRNNINRIIIDNQLDANKIKSIVDKKNLTIEEALIIEMEKVAQRYKKCKDLGLYRCSLLTIGKIKENKGGLKEALRLYMAVCYYDLNGPLNSGGGFDDRLIFMAPAVVDYINKLLIKLSLDENSTYNEFKSIVMEYKEKGMFMDGNLAWECMKKALYEDVLVRGSLEEVMEDVQ